jgi:CHAD domain-containing protein
VREELGEEVFAVENASFRDAGGSLSEARDAAVLVKTLDGLKKSVEGAAFSMARKKMLARRRAVAKRVLEAGNGLEAVAVLVDEARARVANWKIQSDGWEALRPGLKRIYAEARAAYERAEIDSEADIFHGWRKRVKDLWHQCEVLEEIWPDVMKGMAQRFHHLADILGEEHDLSVLKAVLEAEALARAEEVSPAVEVAKAQRETLRREAKALGARIFAERAGAFVRRIGAYWTAWKGDGAEVKEEAIVEAGEAKGDHSHETDQAVREPCAEDAPAAD